MFRTAKISNSYTSWNLYIYSLDKGSITEHIIVFIKLNNLINRTSFSMPLYPTSQLTRHENTSLDITISVTAK